MIDLKDYRTNPQKYIQGAEKKRVAVDRERFNVLDEQLREARQEIDEANGKRNYLSSQIDQIKRSWGDVTTIVEQVKEIKSSLQQLEEKFSWLEDEFKTILYTIPNPPLEDVPVGASEAENVVADYIGKKPEFDFEPKPHREILEAKGYTDQERAVKLSGSRFQIARAEFAKLEFALINRLIDKLSGKWFQFTLVPHLVKEDALFTTGFLPNEATNLYRVNPKSTAEQKEREEDDLRLIGTAEVALVSQHMNETFDASELPLRYFGFSFCFRREAGTYGKDTKGLIRVHQFEKVEMVSFVKPEDSLKEHEYLREIEEEIFTDLGIHFQRIHICTGDTGWPAAKKYDLEARFPGIWAYKEVTSTSNTTDFQTRRGWIKFKDGDRKDFAHSLNGTAAALGRCLAAIVETYQTKEGNIRIPDVLKKYMGGREEI